MGSPKIAMADSPKETGEGLLLKTKRSLQGLLKHNVFRAASWTVVERVLSQVIRLAGNIVLSRLLFPEAFGIAATIAMFQEALVMFTDLGTGAVVVQHQHGDKPEFLNTVWTVQILRGFALTVVAIAISWPAASWWLHKPDLALMLAVSSLQLAISGCMSIKLSVALRQMKIGALARRNLVSQVLGLVMTIILAFLMRSAWAMVFGSILASVCQTVLSYLMLPGPSSRFGWDRETLNYVSHFGRWTFASTIMTFIASRGDSVLMARYLSEAMFGIYNISNSLSAVPTLSIHMLGGRIIFPVLSKVAREDRSRLPAAYDRTCSLIYLASLPAIGLLAGLSPTIVHILFDPRYWEAGWLTRILTIRAAMDCLFAPGKAVLTALGLPRYSAIAQATRAVILIAGLPLAYQYFGVTGTAVVAASNGLLAIVVVQWGLFDNGLFNLGREVKGIVWFLAGAVFGYGVDQLLSPLFQ